MILVDANLLLYAYDSSSPFHGKARTWWENTLSATEAVRLSWQTVLAFVRVSTNPRVLVAPLSPARALSHVDTWLEVPTVEILQPGVQHWALFKQLIAAIGTAANLTMDAHLAALAIEHGCTLCSTDTDFARFEGLRCINPLRAKG